jgi:hypothetical protein
MNADMADEAAFGLLDQDAQVGMGKTDVAPRQLVEDLLRPDRLHERLGKGPGLVAVQNVDFDAHCL